MKRTPLSRKTPLKPSGGLNKAGKGLSKGKGLKKVSEAGKAKRIEKNGRNEKMIKMFQEIWEERGPYCQISRTYLGMEPLTVFFHHILPKNENAYPQYCLKKWNIIMLTWELHDRVENDLSSVPEVYELTKQFEKLHNQGLL